MHGWTCRVYGSIYAVDRLIDVVRECKRSKGNNATAAYSNYNNPYSWYCIY